MKRRRIKGKVFGERLVGQSLFPSLTTLARNGLAEGDAQDLKGLPDSKAAAAIFRHRLNSLRQRANAKILVVCSFGSPEKRRREEGMPVPVAWRAAFTTFRQHQPAAHSVVYRLPALVLVSCIQASKCLPYCLTLSHSKPQRVLLLCLIFLSASRVLP